MDGMGFISRDRRPEAAGERQISLLRYAIATWAVFALILAMTLFTIAVLDQAGIHLPVADEGFSQSGVAAQAG